MTDTEDFNDDDLGIIFNVSFKAIRVYKNQLTPVTWKVKAHLIDVISYSGSSEDEIDYKIDLSLEKIRFWFQHYLDGSLIFSYDNEWAFSSFFKDGISVVKNKVVITPQEPSDEVLSWLFQAKMNAFSDNGNIFTFTCIEISSDDSDGLEFFYLGSGVDRLPDMKSWVGELSYFNEPWWARDDSSTIDVKPSCVEDLPHIPSFAHSLDFLGDSFKRIYGC